MLKENEFVPFKIPSVSSNSSDTRRLTCTTTLRGDIVNEFEDVCEKYGLNRSQLMTQMVYHCLGRTADLQEFYKRVAILGK